MKRIFSLTVVFISFFLLLIFTVGFTAPVEYKGFASTFYNYPVDDVFDQLVDINNIPADRYGVEKVIITKRDNKLLSWTEELKNGGYRKYEMVEFEKPRMYKLRLVDSSIDMKGEYDFRLEKINNGTLVTVYEESELSDVWYRGLHTFAGRNIHSKMIVNDLRQSLKRDFIDKI